MTTTMAKTGGRAKYCVRAVSVALAGTKFRSTVRRVIGVFDTIGEARGFAEVQARRQEVKNARSRIRFVIQYKGRSVVNMGEVL